MTRIQINQMVFGLRQGVLGATANRMGIWTQGCSLPKCPGCTSTHTWSPQAGRSVSINALLQLALAQAQPPSGLTVSGGEPTDQAESVAALVREFRQTFPNTEVVLYTGLRWPVLSARHVALVSLLDVAVTGPFVRTLDSTPLSGSANQEVHLLTPLAERLYRGWNSWPKHLLQAGCGGRDQVVTVGIPDTPRMAKAARQVAAADMTWDQSRGKKQS